jgi:transposase
VSGYIKGTDNNQMSFGIMSLDDMIGPANKVRAISAIVDTMEMSKHEFVHSAPSGTGRPPHDPVKMFKLYLYSYFEKIRSSRCIEKECTRNIEAMWLMEQIVPDHKCIAEFRRQNGKAIKTAFGEFIGICDELELLSKSLVAIDGSKFRANNARKKNITVGGASKKIEYFQKRLDEYICELDENDGENTEKIEKTKGKIEGLEALKKDLEEKGIKDVSLTDPDSRLMITANMGYEVSYNVQTSVDSKHDLIVATEVITTPSDQGQLYDMTRKTVDVFGTEKDKPVTALADKGYFEGKDIQSCEEDGLVNAIVARPGEKCEEGYQKSKFIYDDENDQYICPQEQTLYRKGAKNRQEYSNQKACKKCVYRERCTKREKGRIIIRSEYEASMEACVARFNENKELYKQRQMIVEHPFGTIKRTLGFSYFLMRGIENVKTENHLHMLTYNIKRLLNIYGIQELMRKLAEIQMEKQEDALCFYYNTAILFEILFRSRKYATKFGFYVA